MKKCVFGTHGRRRTWCHHPLVTKGQKTKSVANAHCASCPYASETIASQPSACLHRGDQVDTINTGCAACKGQPIFECDIHQLAVQTQRQREEVRGSRACDTCPDFQLPTTVALVAPVWCVGGVERWWLTLARYAPPSVFFSGVHVPRRAKTDPTMVAELNQAMPLYEHCDTHADVVITWTDTAFTSRPGSRHLHVLHLSTPWSIDCAKAHPDAELIAVSDLVASVAPRSCTTIPNAVDPARLEARDRASIRQQWGLDPDQLTIGFVGRLSKEKNPLLPAQAAAELQCPVVYCAAGPDDWKRQIESIAPRVIWVSPDDPAAVYYGADCLIMPSKEEAAGLVYLEAWHCGIPVVSYGTGVVPEAESLARQRLTERIDEHATIGTAVRASLRHPQRVFNAQRLVLLHYSPEPWAARWAAVLTSTLSV